MKDASERMLQLLIFDKKIITKNEFPDVIPGHYYKIKSTCKNFTSGSIVRCLFIERGKLLDQCYCQRLKGNEKLGFVDFTNLEAVDMLPSFD